MIPPQHIADEMWDTLYQISDETGEQKLDGYVLKYEGWSPSCFPPKLPEKLFAQYADQQTLEVVRTWNSEMRLRGYRPVESNYDSHLGLYGVTYALYKKTKISLS